MKTVNYLPRQRQLETLIQILGLPDHTSVDWLLLDLALTHPTASAEANYEQLEFVGDAVIRLAVAEFVFETYPDLPVGEFAALRSILVSDRTLARLSELYGLSRYLVISSSASKDMEGLESRLAEAFEAILGALYLSTHTMDLISPWLNPHLKQLSEEILADPARQNYKAALQEWTQLHHKSLPEYRVTETSTIYGDTERFHAEVWFRGQQLGQGRGRSIKAAEQTAAQAAMAYLQQHPD